MKLIKTPTKGMNDYLPSEVALREYVKSVIVSSYTADGFCMIETPAVEHIENLTGKNGGENEKLIIKGEDILKMALAKELNDQLHRCIAMLPKAERELIQAIYFDGMSDTEYSKRIKRSQQIVSYNHKKILSKLKMLMKLLTSF